MYQYLVDENLSKSDSFLKTHPEFANVKYALYVGAKDEMIVRKAKDEDLIIVTKDTGLALKALIAGVRVWYFDTTAGDNDYKLVAQNFE